MISKLLETIENLSRRKSYNNYNTTTTNNSCNDDSKIPSLNNTHLAPPQWDILSTTPDTITNSDNGRSSLRYIKDCNWKRKSGKKNLTRTH